MNLNKFTNNLDDAPLHSSGYAEVSNNKQIGATSPQTFSQRLHIERNRQSVGRYHDSMIANGHHRNMHYQRAAVSPAPMRSEQPEATTRPFTNSRTIRRPAGGLISDVVKPTMRQSFSEPPARGYNPYK
jgi:hypothetical protein